MRILLALAILAGYCLISLADEKNADGANRVAADQIFTPPSKSASTELRTLVAGESAPRKDYPVSVMSTNWLTEMARRLEPSMPRLETRLDFLRAVHYEATRAGIDPQLVLAIIQVKSNFHKYAVSNAGARGYMQIMPFWIDLIGKKNENLFSLRANLRFGCVILRHYLDIENGDMLRALGRYDGSPGQTKFPILVNDALRSMWQYDGTIR